MPTILSVLTVLATTALPPPPGTRASAPSLQESLGTVPKILAFDGTYGVPFAEARVRFEGHVRAHGWRPERTVELGNRQGVTTDLALTFTNGTERLSALLSSVRPRQTALKYQIEKKADRGREAKDLQSNGDPRERLRRGLARKGN